jgi:hypothetical protein
MKMVPECLTHNDVVQSTSALDKYDFYNAAAELGYTFCDGLMNGRPCWRASNQALSS